MTTNYAARINGINRSLVGIDNIMTSIIANATMEADNISGSYNTVLNQYSVAFASYQALSDGGMTNQEIADAYANQVFPAPNPSVDFANVNQKYNAWVGSFENDVWPIFNGTVYTLNAGNLVPIQITKPAAFDTASQDFKAALSAFIEVQP